MLKPIKTDEQYSEALARVYELMQTDIKEGTATSDELEVLSILIKEYEVVQYPVPSPSPFTGLSFQLSPTMCQASSLTLPATKLAFMLYFASRMLATF